MVKDRDREKWNRRMRIARGDGGVGHEPEGKCGFGAFGEFDWRKWLRISPAGAGRGDLVLCLGVNLHFGSLLTPTPSAGLFQL